MNDDVKKLGNLDVLKFAENSDDAISFLFVAFGYIDGYLHDNEIKIIRNACIENGIDLKLIDHARTQYEKLNADPGEICEIAMTRITDEELRNLIVVILCEIASADDVFDKNEKLFLELVADTWDIEVISQRKFTDWDENQNKVITKPANSRIIVYAGPGMGKTAVACARVSELIESGLESSNIWLLSFTRTAVKEIRDRIESFSEDSNSTLGIKIGTIDSRAWRIRCGFTENDIKKYFGSYESNIKDVIEIINRDTHEIQEFLESIEHILIDEAQDITGLRARLILDIIELLPENCGVTIFADPAQAIYDFTNDNGSVEDGDRINFLDLLNEKQKFEFKEFELQTIYRTDSEDLIELIEELRLDIYVNENIGLEGFNKRRDFIIDKAHKELDKFSSNELNEYKNALVLFRKRAEVLMASSFACSDGIKHRIRMSGLPTVTYPWIAQLFYDYTAPTVNRESFNTLWEEKIKISTGNKSSQNTCWNLLKKLTGNNKLVSINKLRKKVSRTPPDINACVPDLGNDGPIIGTIHASKGREAEQVILRLPKNISYNNEKLDEESRVLFVGASRAQSSLLVGNGFVKASYAPALSNGRAFLKTKPTTKNRLPAALVELGRDGDIDFYSLVSKNIHSQKDAVQIQKDLSILSGQCPLKLDAVWEPSMKFRYKIHTNFSLNIPARHIGYFNEVINKDLFEISNRITGDSNIFRPPNRIKNFYLIGVSTYAAKEDDIRLSEVHEPFDKTGIWLVPVIIGFPQLLFFHKKRY